MSSIHVGSKVKIKAGQQSNIWDYYKDWAEQHGLKNFSQGARPSLGVVYEVVAIEPHSSEASDTTCYGIEGDGCSFIMAREALELMPDPALADHLELFDRVRVNGFKFIVVTDHNGNKALLGEYSGWVSPEDVSTLAAIEIYERPIFTADLFDFSMIGKLKYQSPKSVRKQELTEKIITLQEQLTEAGEELAALN